MTTPSPPRPPSDRAARGASPVDALIDPARWPEDPGALRRARVVVTIGVMALGAHAALSAALFVGAAPRAPYAVMAGAALLTSVALGLVRWGGRVEAAAWVVTLTLAVVPVLQGGLDGGVRDPALGLVAFAPLVAAMVSGARLAAITTVVAVGSVVALYALEAAGLTPPPFSRSGELAVYATVAASCAAVLSALAGVLYVRHTRAALGEAEAHSEQLDAALRESEARYRSVVEHVPVGMYRTAPDGRILLANAALARMIGAADVAEARELSALDFYVDPAARRRFCEIVDRTGSVRRFEAQWRRLDGEVRAVRIDARAAFGADGRPLYYEGAVEDVTAEQEAREALYRSEARFRALVQRSTDVTVVLDRAQALTYVSPSVTALLGHRPDALKGTAFADLVHPDDRALAAALAAETPGGGAQVEVRLRHAEGHDVFVEGVGAALYDDAVVSGLLLNLRDVTERKRAQAVLLKAKEQAEEVARLKSTFLANMSHEIRTPLTAILGFADILGEEVEDPAQQEFVDLIARSGRRLMDTLNSVLDLARLEAGRGDLARDRIDLGAVVAEAVDMFQPAATERGLTIAADVAPGALDVVLDEPALARVIHNLVGNALKFTDRGGVVVSARPDPEGLHGPSVVLEVRDTGIGIDEEFVPRLFGEFEQESSGVERTHEGAGLGLAISRQLVERMGGTIRVASVKGEGTTFTVAFPAAGVAPAGEDRRLLALVVDDNEQARTVAERTLGEQFRVTLAASGDEALAAVEDERPDAVLLDIHLGQSISGEDVMRRLRATPSFADLPMAAVTAYALPGDRERFLAAGFDAYVTKPYARAQLLQAIEEAIQSRAEAARPAEAPPAPPFEGAAYVARKTGPPAPAPAAPVAEG